VDDCDLSVMCDSCQTVAGLYAVSKSLSGFTELRRRYRDVEGVEVVGLGRLGDHHELLKLGAGCILGHKHIVSTY